MIGTGGIGFSIGLILKAVIRDPLPANRRDGTGRRRRPLTRPTAALSALSGSPPGNPDHSLPVRQPLHELAIIVPGPTASMDALAAAIAAPDGSR